MILSFNDTLQPDILVVSESRLNTITNRACEGPPDLIVESLSPTTTSRDWGIKRERYALFGVSEYWIVDPAAQSIEVLTLGGTEFTTSGTYSGDMAPYTEVLPGFEFPVMSISS